MDDRWFQIILALIPILGTIVTYFVVPWIKANIDNERLAQYEEWAVLAVKCAEMIFTEKGMGKDKKAYVVDFLNSKFNKNGIKISEEQINVLIEAAVQELNKNKLSEP